MRRASARTLAACCLPILMTACADRTEEVADSAAPSERGAGVDNSQWPLFRGGPTLDGVARTSLVDQPELLWSLDVGSDIESTAAIVDGTVYVGAYDGSFYAIDLEVGEIRWKLEIGEEIKSSPSVRDGVVYFGDEMGFFHAVDTASGVEKWSFETLAGIVSGANFHGDHLVFGSYDNSLYCLKSDDGSLAWQVETDGYVHGTPAIFGDFTTVSGCDGYLWLVNLEDGSVETKIDLQGQTGASPAVVGNRAYVGTYSNQVLGLDLETRELSWSYEHPERKFPYYASAAATEELVIIGGRDKIVHALDANTGEALWTYPAGSRVDSSAVIVGSRAFLATTRGEVLALDIVTGEKVWSYETGSAFAASPSVAQSRLVISSLDGVIYCFG